MPCQSDRPSVSTSPDHQIERRSISVQQSLTSNGTVTMSSSVLPTPSAALVTSSQSSFASEHSKASSRLVPLKGVAKLAPKSIAGKMILTF